MIKVHSSLQKYLLPEGYSIQCPFCKQRFSLHQTKKANYNACQSGFCNFSVNIKGDNLYAIHFLTPKHKNYVISQHYESHFIGKRIIIDKINERGNNENMINLREIIEFNFDDIDEQIETILLFS